jgi:lysophospholipase L1-like esterase
MKLAPFFLGFLFCLSVRAQTPPANLIVQNGQTIAFLGDSITDMGWNSPGGYIKLVVSGLDTMGVKVTPLPCGHGGNRSVEMLARVDQDVIAKRPDWMLLNCGVNDVWGRSVDLAAYAKNITAIVDKAQAVGIKVMLLSPTPIYEESTNEFNDKLPGYVALMAQLARERKLPFADLNAAYMDYFKAHPEPGNHNILTLDGVHPNSDGHQVIARTILRAFGAAPDQVAAAEKAWRAAPDDGAEIYGFGFHVSVPVSAEERAALEKIAAGQKIPLSRLVYTAYLETIRDVLVARGDLSGVGSPDDISKLSEAPMKKRLDDLAGVSGGTPVDPPITCEFGFRVGVPMSLDEYDALKKLAAEKKTEPVQLVLTSFVATVRDLLVARGDLSKTWSDNISAESAPALKSRFDDMVKAVSPAVITSP